MPKSKRNNPSFTFYFNDLTKLVKIMISLKKKDILKIAHKHPKLFFYET